jgi:hypothetical protein
MRFGSKVWLSRRIETPNATMPSYEEPIEIVTRPNYFTVMSAVGGGYVEVMKHGETIYDTWNIVANANVFCGKIKQGDLMWVDGQEPIEEIEKENGIGSSANAVVNSVSEGNISLSIVLKTNHNKVK